MKQARMFFLATLIALPVWAGGDSSDGHNHAAPESILTAAIAPRATTASDEFEIVAALEGNQLVVYVDRFASNAPVANAKVEVEGAGLKGYASETAPGTYVMNVAAATLPARHPLAITIEAGDTTDLLSTTLDTSRPVASNEPVVGWSARVVWIIAGTLLLAAGALLAVRRRKKGI